VGSPLSIVDSPRSAAGVGIGGREHRRRVRTPDAAPAGLVVYLRISLLLPVVDGEAIVAESSLRRGNRPGP
jgi:hypothetical protein